MLCRYMVFTGLLVFVLVGCSVQKSVVQQEPLTGREHLALGVAYERQGEWDLALQEYAQAAESDPRGNFYMGNLLFQQNRLGDAEDAYRSAMERMRSDPDLFNNLAWLLYTRRDKLEEAEELAGLAVRLGGAERVDEYRDTLEQIRQAREEMGED